ncbi:MAG: shikimate dehydrogenase family protein [Candidatus Planktophila sp.]
MINAAVLGSPISHSLSPHLHMSAYKFLNIPGKYTSFEVPAGSLHDFLRDKDSGWTGFSLTMPLKEEVLAIADSIDPLVKRIQSGNTLVRQNNEWFLYSTDVLGFQQAWNTCNSAKPQSVLIIGSGATARAAAAAFDNPDTSISVVHRNNQREESMRLSVLQSKMKFLPWQFVNDFYESELVVNTTPKGVLDSFACNVVAKPAGTFFDVIYNPWPTEFASAWMKTQSPVISGLDLLIAQGIEQIRLFTETKIDAEALSKFLREEITAQ